MREIISALARHLHAFAREVRLSEEEFQAACGYVVAIGKHSNETHNEAVLMSGSLGLSSLVCLLNNGNRGQTETDANFCSARSGAWIYRSYGNGDFIVRSPTPGPVLCRRRMVQGHQGNPIEGAEVDIWNSSPEGFYENQDPVQADMNLRGKFTTDKNGHISFRSVKPAGYPIPVDGPVGALLRAAGRHNMRPAHLHFLAYKTGFKTLISQVYDPEDKNLETDAQFGVTRHLIGNFGRHDKARAETPDVTPPWYSIEHTFIMEAGTARLPRPPITGKAQGERPQIPHLERV